MTPIRTANWPLIWVLVAVEFAVLEGITLGEPQSGDSFSECWAMLRFDPIGRFVALPLVCWLVWHLALRPKATPLFTWRDVVGLCIGLTWALIETRRGITL